MCVCTCRRVCMHVHMCMDTQACGSPWLTSSFFLSLSTMFIEASQLACNPTIGQQGVRAYSMQRQKTHWGFLAKIVSPGSVKSFDLKNKVENERNNNGVTGGCHAQPGSRHTHPALLHGFQFTRLPTSTLSTETSPQIPSWESFKENF